MIGILILLQLTTYQRQSNGTKKIKKLHVHLSFSTLRIYTCAVILTLLLGYLRKQASKSPMIPSTIWGFYLLSLSRLSVYNNDPHSIDDQEQMPVIPESLRNDPVLAQYLIGDDLEKSIKLLLKETKRSLRSSTHKLQRTQLSSQDRCEMVFNETVADLTTRKLMFRIPRKVAQFTGKAVGAGVGALFECMYPTMYDDSEYTEPATPEPMLPGNKIIKFKPLLGKVSSLSQEMSFHVLMRPPTVSPTYNDEDWEDVETDVGSDDEDEYVEVEEVSDDEIAEIEWDAFIKTRKASRGIETISPRELTRVPAMDIYITTILSKLSYHSMDELEERAPPEVRHLMKTQIAGFPILIDSDRAFDTQVYLWLPTTSRTLYVAFRGTDSWTDVRFDLDYRLASLSDEVPEVKVHSGFHKKYLSIEAQLFDITMGHQELFDKIVVTGHSLGGGLATVAAPMLAAIHPSKTLECLTFGAPRAGNAAFVNWFRSSVSVNLRIVNDFDPIQSLPLEGHYHHVSHAISLSETGEVCKVPDAPADQRLWNALEDLDFDRFVRDHKLNTYIERVNSLLKKHN